MASHNDDECNEHNKCPICAEEYSWCNGRPPIYLYKCFHVICRCCESRLRALAIKGDIPERKCPICREVIDSTNEYSVTSGEIKRIILELETVREAYNNPDELKYSVRDDVQISCLKRLLLIASQKCNPAVIQESKLVRVLSKVLKEPNCDAVERVTATMRLVISILHELSAYSDIADALSILSANTFDTIEDDESRCRAAKMVYLIVSRMHQRDMIEFVDDAKNTKTIWCWFHSLDVTAPMTANYVLNTLNHTKYPISNKFGIGVQKTWIACLCKTIKMNVGAVGILNHLVLNECAAKEVVMQGGIGSLRSKIYEEECDSMDVIECMALMRFVVKTNSRFVSLSRNTIKAFIGVWNQRPYLAGEVVHMLSCASKMQSKAVSRCADDVHRVLLEIARTKKNDHKLVNRALLALRSIDAPSVLSEQLFDLIGACSHANNFLALEVLSKYKRLILQKDHGLVLDKIFALEGWHKDECANDIVRRLSASITNQLHIRRLLSIRDLNLISGTMCLENMETFVSVGAIKVVSALLMYAHNDDDTWSASSILTKLSCLAGKTDANLIRVAATQALWNVEYMGKSSRAKRVLLKLVKNGLGVVHSANKMRRSLS